MRGQAAIFVDGENLVIRFQKMIEAGWVSSTEVVHFRDQFVWHPKTSFYMDYDVQRVSYYTSTSGDQNAINLLCDQIQEVKYYTGTHARALALPVVPKVFHKSAKAEKSRHVDIAITLDVLVATFTHSLDAIVLISGDKDYVPLIREVARRGKRAEVFALSSGLSPELRRAADITSLLDSLYFEKSPSPPSLS
jgi:uncharacterized LabA/DUF88 family protein